ncbi:MAG TPA: hypothetical protein VGQ78_01315 [Vicinamibacteria bacterium]|nr:hypothetical protein [Vicinamibacteria bacterium]
MEGLRRELVELLDAMNDEEVIMVLAYARGVRDGAMPNVSSLEELVEEPA